MKTIDDYHKNVDKDYNRNHNIDSPYTEEQLRMFFESAFFCRPIPDFFNNRNFHTLDAFAYSRESKPKIKPENIEKIELLLAIAKQLRVTRREIYLYIRGIRS